MDYQLGTVETRFAEIVWANEPLSSSTLAQLCEKELKWKKSTTYTVLKRLCNKGIFVNSGGTVSSLVSQDEFYSLKSRQFVNETFKGSLPAFIAAFSSGKELTEREASELRRLLREYEEGR